MDRYEVGRLLLVGIRDLETVLGTQGDATVDTIVLQLARRLQTDLRVEDVLARFDDGTFAILYRNTDATQTL